MPYRRAGFALTPPSLVIFVISLVLAALAFLRSLCSRFRPDHQLVAGVRRSVHRLCRIDGWRAVSGCVTP
jgi:hypothetical protein